MRTPEHPQRRILIVDDDHDLGHLIERILTREGYATQCARSRREVLQRCEEAPPDLMLLDLNLPDATGQGLVENLGARIPFIIMTGHGDEKTAVEMMKIGASDYLVKDREFLELLPSVLDRFFRKVEGEHRLKAAEEALKREHQFIQAILDTTGSLVVVLGREGHVVRWNRACEQLTGLSAADAAGLSLSRTVVIPEEIAFFNSTLKRVLEGHFPVVHENHWKAADGESRMISWSTTGLLDASDRVEFIVSSGIDITDRKRLEKEVLEISDREQQRIGHDLHDGLCQSLASIELMSQTLVKRLGTRAPEEAHRAGRIAEHVRETIRQTRMLARGLSPVLVDDFGLLMALQELAANTEKLFQVRCDIRVSRPVLLRDHTAATHLYRIAQEAVSNAIKHGKARRITIGLGERDNVRFLSILDDGGGFPRKPRSDGMGLRIMRFRAGMIGGSLQVQAADGAGTLVDCTFSKNL